MSQLVITVFKEAVVISLLISHYDYMDKGDFL